MAENQVGCSTDEKNGWTLWHVRGRLDRLTAPAISEEAEALLAATPKFAVEMSELEYLSSAGIRVLLRLMKQARTEDREFALVAPAGMVRVVLSESRLDLFTSIYDSVEELP